MLRRAALVFALLAPANAQRALPSPEQFLGHAVGADRFLATYTQLADYWRALAAASDRMRLEEIGTTSYGQTHLVAVISSPANLRALDELRAISERLCRAEGVDEEHARALAARGRAVVWIDAGMHATESVAAQNILELVWRMVSRDDAEVRRILDEVILLVCPANPDGMELVAKTYMAIGRVNAIPVLYQRWIGHDNNRDYYACTQQETRNISAMFYRRWYPQIIYNHHQSAPRGTVIFTPPFREPFNYNFDPMVVRGIELVAAHMNQRFASEGKAGVISRTGAPYSTWWNGGLRTTAYFHNMIGILTESFGNPDPTPLEPRLERRLPSGDYPDPVEGGMWHARQTIEYLQTANFAILDLAARFRERLLLDIWRMGERAIARGSRDHWTVTPKMIALARAQQPAANAAADADAGEGETAGGDGDGDEKTAEPPPPVFRDPALRDPRAYVLPADQPDANAAMRFVNALWHSGIDVYRTTAPVAIGDRHYPSGSHVVLTAQAFRAHVLDMFEPQWHPDDVDAKGEPIRPYDSAGWTLAMQTGVVVDRLRDAPPPDLLGRLAKLAAPALREGALGAPAPLYLLDARDIGAYAAANRLLAAGDRVGRLRRKELLAGVEHPAGTLCITAQPGTRERLETLARELGVDFAPMLSPPRGGLAPLRPLRIGLFDVWGGDMATGWTQWVLEQAAFPVQLVFGERIHAGELRSDFDVLVFHTGIPSPRDGGRVQRALRRGRPNRVTDEELARLRPALPAFSDWSSLDQRRVTLDRDKTIANLRAFVEAGGTLIALGDSAVSLAKHFELAVRDGTWTTGDDGNERRTKSSEFFVPGSLLRLDVDPADPLALGLPAEPVAVFRQSPVFDVPADARDITVHARYARSDLLASGWALGEQRLHGKAAVLSAKIGAGKVFLFGADVVYRGQPTATWKLLFNALQETP